MSQRCANMSLRTKEAVYSIMNVSRINFVLFWGASFRMNVLCMYIHVFCLLLKIPF